jgi:hypothetical protein
MSNSFKDALDTVRAYRDDTPGGWADVGKSFPLLTNRLDRLLLVPLTDDTARLEKEIARLRRSNDRLREVCSDLFDRIMNEDA